MIIRKINKEDLMTRVEWMNNPRIYQSMHFNLPITIEDTLKWYRKNFSDNSRVDVAFADSHENLVAMGGLTHIDWTVKKAELYIFINPEIHGKGFGTYSTALLCNYGFSELGLNKIYLYTNEDNLAARVVYERIGFQLEGHLRHEIITANGDFQDRLYYGILRNEFNREQLNEMSSSVKACGGIQLIITDSRLPENPAGITCNI